VSGAPAIWAALPIFFAISCSGFLMGNTTSLAIGTVRQAAGQGSAVLGASQFVLGAVVTPLAGIGGGFTAVPMAMLMLGCCLCAGALFLVSGRIAARRAA